MLQKIERFRNLFNLAILDAVFVIPGKAPGSRITKSWINQKCLIKRFKVVADKYRNRRRRFGLRHNFIAGIYKIAMDPGALPGMTKISHSKIFLTECHAQIGFERGLMYRTMSGLIAVLLFLFLSLTPHLHAVSYGSNATPTRPSRLFFPNTDTNNTLLGFVEPDSGFFLEDYTTKCTYNARFQVAGDIGLTGGSLYLLQDMVMSNTLNLLTIGGLIDGSSHSLELPYTNQTFQLPVTGALGAFSMQQVAALPMSASNDNGDWNYAGQYIMGGCNTGGAIQLQLYYFNGLTLTATDMTPAGGVLAQNSNSIGWYPTDNFCAVCMDVSTANNVFIYYKRSNGSFQKLQTFSTTSGICLGLSFHPSGKYICFGESDNTLKMYNFSASTGQIGALINSVALGGTPWYDTVAFAPSGNYVATGLQTGTTNQLQVIPVAANGTLGTPIGYTFGATGPYVYHVGWHPTLNYLSVGLNTGTQNIRLFAFNPSTNALTEVVSARVTESQQIADMDWDPTGTFLVVARETGTTYCIRMFYFDTVNLVLREVYRDSAATNPIPNIRYSPNGKFIAYIQINPPYNAAVLGVLTPPFMINNLTMLLNSNTTLGLPIQVKGTCRISGRGKRLTLASGAGIVVRPGATLLLDDVELAGVGGNNLACMTNAGLITLRQCQIDLAKNFTFSNGSLFLQETVALTGTNAFVFSSGRTCTIDTLATLYVDHGVTLQYAPNRPVRNLLYFTDPTSILYLNNCSLTCTRTGLQLSGGTLIFDNGVTLSSQALHTNERMSLVSTMTINVRAGANVSLYGYVGAD